MLSSITQRLKGRSMAQIVQLVGHNIAYHAREMTPQARRRNRQFRAFDAQWGTDTFGMRELMRNLVVLASAGSLGWLGWRSDSAQQLLADYRTQVGERREVRLADGSGDGLHAVDEGIAGAACQELGLALKQRLPDRMLLGRVIGPALIYGPVRAGWRGTAWRKRPFVLRHRALRRRATTSCAATPSLSVARTSTPRSGRRRPLPA